MPKTEPEEQHGDNNDAPKQSIPQLVSAMAVKIAPILLLALVLLTLSLRLGSLADPHLLEFDTVYFHRVAEQIAQTGRFNPNEMIRYYPSGWDSKFLKPLPPYSVAALCKLSPVGCDPKYASKWYAPFFSVLLVVVMAYIGYRASGDWIISAALLSFMPGILFRSASGFTDKDTIALFLMIFSLYFAYRAIQEKTTAGSLLQGIFGGITMGLATISMSSYVLYLFPVAIFAVIQVLRKKINGSLLGLMPFLSLPFFILLTLDYRNSGLDPLTDLHSMMILAVAVLIGMSYWIFNSRRFAHASANRKLGYAVAAILVIGLVGLYATGRNISALVEDVAASISNPIRGSTHSSSVGEQQATSWAWPWEPGWQGRNSFWDQTSYLFFISPLILVVAYITKRDEDILTASLFFFNMFAASKAIRLMVTFAPLAALAGGEVFSFALKKTSKNTLLKALVVIAAAFVVFNLYQITAGQSKYIHTSVNQEWYEDFKWINLNTKQNAPVVTWWDYGYWIQYFARRPSVADGENTGPGAAMNVYLGQFFTDRNETRAINWLTGVCAMDTCARLITFDATMIGKMYWSSAIAWDSKNVWTPKLVGNSISYSTFQYMDTRETPWGSARVYADQTGTVFLARVDVNGTVLPIIINPSTGAQGIISDILTPYGIIKIDASKVNVNLPKVPGGVSFYYQNNPIFMPPEAEDNVFTTTFIMDAIPPRCIGFELKNEPGGKFCEVFNNGFTKTFMV